MVKSRATVLAVLLMWVSGPALTDDSEASSTDRVDALLKELERQKQEATEKIEKFKLYEKFQLYNGCLPMNLVVEGLSADGKEIGLSKETIQNALESRLRAAHLYQTPENFPETARRARLLFPGKEFDSYLYARVSVVGRAFSLDLRYNKLVVDEISGVKHYATTWERSITGTAPDAGFIMSTLASPIDAFLVEFLRVNEPDCQAISP